MRWLLFALLAGFALAALLLLLVVAVTWPPTSSVELAGGVSLVYRLDDATFADPERPAGAAAVVDEMALRKALTGRLDPDGTRAITVRRAGDREVEILAPQVDPLEVQRIKQLIRMPGALEFRLIANPTDHEKIIALAEAQAADPGRRPSRSVQDGARAVGRWVRVGRDPAPVARAVRPLKVFVAANLIRNAATGEILRPPADLAFDHEHALERWLQEQGIAEIDVLMATDDGFDVTGAYLARVRRGVDELAHPCVEFSMNRQGAALMAGLTSSYLPDTSRGFYRCLGIILDDTLLTAPRLMSTISDRGRITGNFTREEVDSIASVLEAGSLPCSLQEVPVAELIVSPAETAVRTTTLVAGIGLAVLAALGLLMLLRYRLMGCGACLASVLQLLLVAAAIQLLHVPVSLPLVAALAAITLVTGGGHALLCELGQRAVRDATAGPRAIWGSLACGAVPLAILFLAVGLISLGLYVLAGAALRNVAFTLFVASAAAIPTSCLGLTALVGLIGAGQRPGPGDEILVAELAGTDVPPHT